MRSLYEVISNKLLIENVVEIIQKSGFTRDVKVYCGDTVTRQENVLPLTLVISQREGVALPLNRTLLLAAKLSEQFQCTVKIERIQEYSDPSAYGILRLCAGITDEAKICELFGVRSTKAIFLDNSSRVDQEDVKRANDYLANAGYKEITSDVAAEREPKKSKSDPDSPQEDTVSPPKVSGPSRK